jgi:glycerol-3-phosphate O-acyltransferase
MGEAVAVPFWLALLAAPLAAWALYEHVALPLLRWLVMRPANQVIDEIGQRLRIGIRPFQRTRRQALIHRLLTDPKVQQAAEQFSSEKKIPLQTTMQIVERYARETVPAFNAYLYFRIGYWVGKRLAQLLYRVRLGYVDSENLARVESDATVVFVMNHRSNMDYVLAGYLAADQTALSYAVGEWARIWPLSHLIRWMGAYFVRRNSKRGFRIDGERDLVFIPLGINYDRVLEDRTLLRSADPAAQRRGSLGALGTTLGFLFHNLHLSLRSRWYRFGYACVNFGAPVSMRDYCRSHNLDFHRLSGEERKREMTALGRHLMDAVGRIVPVLPVPLIATIFTRYGDKPISELELKVQVERLAEELRARGAHVYVPRRDFDYALNVGLRMLLLRRLVGERDGLYYAHAGELPLLRYYANSIAHLA